MIQAITGAWTDVMEWIVTAIGSVQDVFYNTETSALTFLGTLSIISVAVGVAFLVIGVIQNFLHLRG